MNTENELKAIRYLLNDLILYVYDLRIKLEELSPTKRSYLLKGEPNATGDTIGFDLFSIRKNKYESLVSIHGIDIVNRACVKLDEFIKLNSYIPYKQPSLALSKRFINEVKVDIEKERKEKEIIDGRKMDDGTTT